MMFLLKRPSILMLLLLTVVSFSCKKNTPVAPPVPVPSPPPPPPTPPNAPAPTITLSANTTAINAGQSVTLTYTATNATSVTIDPGIGAVTPVTGGTRVVTPTALTTYTATANGAGGTARSAGVTVTVAAAPRPAPPTPADPPRPPAPTNRPLSEIFTSTMVPVLFDYDKSTIRPTEESKLNNMAAWLKQNAAVRFTIDGNADERGGQEYNIALGDDRAAAVKKYLASQGVAEARMNATSYGEERPLCREQTESCWQRNRRAGFTMVP